MQGNGKISSQILRLSLRKRSNNLLLCRLGNSDNAGILVALDTPNNFPQLPVRNDGPFLVWLGILRDEESLKESFTAAAQRVGEALASENLLRDTPELLVLEPTPRSRLRWFPAWQ